MKTAIRPAILVLVLLGAFALGQLACGGSSYSSPPTAPGMSATPTPAPHY